MIKVFISQPMRGVPVKEIIEDQERAVKMIEIALGDRVELVNSYGVNFALSAEEAVNKPVSCLAESIRLLAKADMAVFLGNIENTRGCKIEYAICKAYNIKTVELWKESDDPIIRVVPL